MIPSIVEKEIAQKRYNECKKCDEFDLLTFRCKMCGCFMKLKAKLLNASCPLNKWQQ